MSVPTAPAPLTTKQRAILRFIVRYCGENGFPPTIREICAEFGISSPNGVVCHLNALAAKGRIVVQPERHKYDTRCRSRALVVPELLAAAKAAADGLLAELNKT